MPGLTGFTQNRFSLRKAPNRVPAFSGRLCPDSPVSCLHFILSDSRLFFQRPPFRLFIASRALLGSRFSDPGRIKPVYGSTSSIWRRDDHPFCKQSIEEKPFEEQFTVARLPPTSFVRRLVLPRCAWHRGLRLARNRGVRRHLTRLERCLRLARYLQH